MVITRTLNQRLINLSKLADIILTCLIVLGALFVPTFLAKIFTLGNYTQLIIGTIVNTSLILTAIYTKGTFKTLAIATLPSISTILGGLLFSSMTVYSKTLIPSIWIGNFIFIFIYKFLFVNKKVNYLLTALLAIIFKVAIIYLGFVTMTILINVPDIVKQTLNISMGITQLITASGASILVFFINYIIKRKTQ